MCDSLADLRRSHVRKGGLISNFPSLPQMIANIVADALDADLVNNDKNQTTEMVNQNAATPESQRNEQVRANAIDKLSQHLKDADNQKFDCAFFKNLIGSAGTLIMELLISEVHRTIEYDTNQTARRRVVCLYLSSTNEPISNRQATTWLRGNSGKAITWKEQFDAMDTPVNFELGCPSPKRKRSMELEELLGYIGVPSPSPPPPSPPPSPSSSD
jgi:hypothetical protein